MQKLPVYGVQTHLVLLAFVLIADTIQNRMKGLILYLSDAVNRKILTIIKLDDFRKRPFNDNLI